MTEALFIPDPNALFDLVDEFGLALLGVSAKYIDSLSGLDLQPRSTHDLGSLRVIGSTGSPLSAGGLSLRVRLDQGVTSIWLRSRAAPTCAAASSVVIRPCRSMPARFRVRRWAWRLRFGATRGD